MAVGIKQDAIVDKGGNVIINCILTTNPFALATPVAGTNVFNLGALSTSDVNMTTSKEEYKSEDGETQASSFTYTLMTTATLMQSDADLINYMTNTVRGAYILEGKYTGIQAAGTDQWIFKIGQVTPAFSVKKPGGTTSMPYEFTGVKLGTSVAFTSTTMGSINTALGLSAYGFPVTALTIPAGTASQTSQTVVEA